MDKNKHAAISKHSGYWGQQRTCTQWMCENLIRILGTSTSLISEGVVMLLPVSFGWGV